MDLPLSDLHSAALQRFVDHRNARRDETYRMEVAGHAAQLSRLAHDRKRWNAVKAENDKLGIETTEPPPRDDPPPPPAPLVETVEGYVLQHVATMLDTQVAGYVQAHAGDEMTVHAATKAVHEKHGVKLADHEVKQHVLRWRLMGLMK